MTRPNAKPVNMPASCKPKPVPEPCDFTVQMQALFADLCERYSASKDPDRIVSLWNMLEFKSESVLAAMAYLGGKASEYSAVTSIMAKGQPIRAYDPIPEKAKVVRHVQTLRDTAEQHGMTTTVKIATRSIEVLAGAMAGDHDYTYQALSTIQRNLETLLECFVSEASSVKFYAMAVGGESYHGSADEVIGPSIIDAFPTTEFDLAEAGRCLSFELWTAAVMHCMRALEEGLRALAHEVSIEPSGNWNKTLNEIESKLRTVRQNTDGREAEQWAAEAGTHLRFVKNAFRNQAMHNTSIYDRHRSTDIFRNTLSFLTHLATKLSPDA